MWFPFSRFFEAPILRVPEVPQFETVLPDNKGLIETLNDFYDGAINEADLTDIIKNIQSDNTTKA